MNKYIKLIFATVFLLLCDLAIASDTIQISGLEQPVSGWKTGLQFLGKWGGIAMFVVAGVMIGLGKAKGESLSLATTVVFAAGVVIAGFAWYPTLMSQGFAF